MALQLQVAGIPLSTYRRWRDELEQWAADSEPSVRVRFAPSLHERIPIIGDRELRQVDANLQEGFSHIAAFARSSDVVAKRYRFDCRVALISGVRVDLASPSATPLVAALDAIARYELRWKEVVGPKAISHPLILPPPTFVPHNDVGNFWQDCDCYRETAKIDRANNLLQKVQAKHRRSRSGIGQFWIDNGERQFVIDPSRHGLAASARAGRRLFRFAYEVAADVHYDVAHARGRSFRIRDRHGREVVVKRANVNPWGDVRPASTA